MYFTFFVVVNIALNINKAISVKTRLACLSLQCRETQISKIVWASTSFMSSPCLDRVAAFYFVITTVCLLVNTMLYLVCKPVFTPHYVHIICLF